VAGVRWTAGASSAADRPRELLPDPEKLGVGERLDPDSAPQRFVDDPEQPTLELRNLLVHAVVFPGSSVLPNVGTRSGGGEI
jgi:hypothetical protein